MNKKIVILYVTLIGILFATIYPFLMSIPFAHDGQFHYDKTINNCTNQDQDCNMYAPLYHRIARFFIWDKSSFIIYNLVLFLIVGSIIFWWFCDKKNWALFFYLAGTGFAITTLRYETYPSAFAILLFLAFLKTDNWLAKASLFILGISTHNYALPLFTFGFIVQYIESKKFFGYFQWFAPVFPIQNYIGLRPRPFVGGLDNWFITNFPAYTIIGGLYWFIKKNWTYTILILFSFFTSFAASRSLGVAQLLSLAGFVYYFDEQKKPQKIILAGFALLYLFFMIKILY